MIARARVVADRGRDHAGELVGAREIGARQLAGIERARDQAACGLVVDLVDGVLRAIEEGAAVIGADARGRRHRHPRRE